MSSSEIYCVDSDTLLGMENSLERLKYLEYDDHFVTNLRQPPITKHHFCVPTHNTAIQFQQYIGLIKWLTSLIYTHKDDNDTDENGIDIDPYDDPSIITQKLLLLLRNLGFEIDFPVALLKQPYGKVAVSIIEFLTIQVLTAKGIGDDVLEPVYYDEIDKHEEDIEICDDESLIGESDMDDDDKSDIVGLDQDEFTSKHETITDEDDDSKRIIVSSIDPAIWKAELERVSDSLQVAYEISNEDDWRHHLKQINTYKDAMKDDAMECERSCQQLGIYSKVIIEKVEAQEQIINENFRHFSDKFKSWSEKMKKSEIAHREASSNVTELTKKVSSISNELENMKVKVDAKSNSMTDTTPLVEIKTAIQRLKADIKDYDLQIGILEHALLQKRTTHASSSIQNMRKRNSLDSSLNCSFEDKQ